MAALEDFHPWTKSLRRLTLDLFARHGSSASSRLLDAGCGTGLFLRDWGQQFGSHGNVGIDFAPAALSLASQRTNAMLIGASASHLPLSSGSFDAVHSADVLQHMTLSGARQALLEFHRVLRNGGLLALRLRATRCFIPELPAIDYNHAYEPRMLREQLRTTGFAVLFLERVNMLPSLVQELSQRFTTPSATATNAPVRGIALREVGNWRDAVLRHYLSMERMWLLSGGPSVAVGHTLLALANKY